MPAGPCSCNTFDTSVTISVNAPESAALLILENTASATNSHAIAVIRNNVGTGGDAIALFDTGQPTVWAIGADRSDGGHLKIANNANGALGPPDDFVTLRRDNGYFGIGVLPSEKLEVVGNVKASGNVVVGGANNGVFQNGNTTYLQLVGGLVPLTDGGTIRVVGNGFAPDPSKAGAIQLHLGNNAARHEFWNGASPRAVVASIDANGAIYCGTRKIADAAGCYYA